MNMKKTRMSSVRRFGWFVMLALCLGLLTPSCKSKEEKGREAAQQHYQKGMALQKAGKQSEAIIEFKNAIQQNPNFAHAYYQLGVALLDQQDVNQGYGNLMKAVELYKGIAKDIKDANEKQMIMDARFRVAELYLNQAFRSRDFSRVEAELKDILAEDPTYVSAYVLRGRMLMALGSLAKDEGKAEDAAARYESAAADLKKAIELQPTRAEAHVILGQLYLVQEQVEQALPLLEKAITLDPKNVQAHLALASLAFQKGEFDKSLELYKKAVELDPKSVQALAGLGEVYLSKNLIDEAVDAAQKILAALPPADGQTPVSQEEVGARFILGRAYLLKASGIEAQDAAGAKALYEKAVAELEKVTTAQNIPSANYSLGIACSKVEKFQQAIEQFLLVLQADSGNISTLQNLAIAYFQEKQYDSAIEYAKKLIALDANNLTGHKLLLDAYLRTNNVAQAQELLAKIETLEPNDPVLAINKAIVALQGRDFAQAIAQAEASLASGQENAFVYNILGRAQAGTNEFEKAEAALKKAVELSPKLLSARLALADVYVKTQKYDLAEAEITAILAIQDLPEAHVILGMAAIGRGQLDAAKAEFEKALAIKSDFTEAQYQLGIVLRGLGKNDGAIASLEQVIASAPEHLPALTNLTLWTFEAGAYDKTLQYAEKLRKVNPDNAVALNVMAAIYAQTGKYDNALAILETLRTVQPDAPNLDVTLGIAYLGKRDFDKAVDALKRAITHHPDNPAAYDALGRAYTAKKEYDLAVEAFSTALEKQADYYPAMLGLGNLRGIQGKYLEALDMYKNVLALKENSPEALIGMAGVYQLTGRQQDALTTFEQVLQLQPKTSVALFNAADVALQLGKYEKTVEYAGRILEADPENVNAQYLLAQAYMLQGEQGKAVAELEGIANAKTPFEPALLDLGFAYLRQDDAESAKATFDKALSANDKQPAAMLGAAIAAQYVGTDAEALEYCQRAMTAQPDNPMAAFVLGNVYVAQKDYEKAKEAFAKAGDFYNELPFDAAAIPAYYSEDPTASARAINVAHSLLARGWTADAIKMLTDITLAKAAREGVIVRYDLARAYAQQGKFDEAIGELEAIIAAQPTRISLYKTIGTLHQNKQEPQKAVEAFKKYAEANPTDDSGKVQLALAYESANMTNEAIAEYTALLQKMPDSALTKNQLAWLYAEKGENLDEAAKLAEEAAQSQPVAGIIDTAGWVYYKRGEYDKAVEKFTKAIELSPFQPTIRYHLGLAYAKAGEKDLALQELNRAFEISADFKEAAEAKALLDELNKP